MTTFKPESGELKPMGELLDQAEVGDQDVEDAIAQWEANPPDERFAAILKAEPEPE